MVQLLSLYNSPEHKVLMVSSLGSYYVPHLSYEVPWPPFELDVLKCFIAFIPDDVLGVYKIGSHQVKMIVIGLLCILESTHMKLGLNF